MAVGCPVASPSGFSSGVNAARTSPALSQAPERTSAGRSETGRVKSIATGVPGVAPGVPSCAAERRAGPLAMAPANSAPIAAAARTRRARAARRLISEVTCPSPLTSTVSTVPKGFARGQRRARPRHLEQGVAPRPDITDADLVFQPAARCQVLANGSWAEGGPKLLVPARQMVSGIGIDGLVGAAVESQVGRTVARDHARNLQRGG